MVPEHACQAALNALLAVYRLYECMTTMYRKCICYNTAQLKQYLHVKYINVSLTRYNSVQLNHVYF